MSMTTTRLEKNEKIIALVFNEKTLVSLVLLTVT
ncbi:hypothetical protein NMY3_02085 [Candidatus Nitrosocosmicus oleophilus]|uniref:Uncharacterized protein n=1 Tax=Candidatus Nitrosocosmicus oleophilus TaxID=1353260 RepID=A0A654M0R3_9ARCH|nr:hypothetical protein NMY3_02085 [Candidatus Nitrosocosmicus oleophilus]